MVSTFTTNKSLEKPGNGDYVDTWNVPVNSDLDVIDQALGTVTSVNLAGGNVVLADTQYRSMGLTFTGALPAARTVTIPSGVGGSWIVTNNTTDASGGPWSVTVLSGGGGTSVALVRGKSSMIYSDGTNITEVNINAAVGVGSVTSVAVSGGTTGLTTSGGPITTSGTITISGTLIPANGGTGITSYTVGDIPYASASGTLSSLASVATGNVLLSGGIAGAPSYGKVGLTTHVTGTLPVANGGTGVTSSTGSGSVVLSSAPTLSSPVLTTPNLGTPSAVTLTNGTGLPIVAGTTGTLTIARGGNGLTSTPTNGQIDIGNGTGFTRTTLTAGIGITVTNGSGSITIAGSAPLTLGTAQSTTSGTSKDFTGIPSWVKRITIIFNSMSFNTNDYGLLQIGDAGGLETTGYFSIAAFSGGSSSQNTSTTGFTFGPNNNSHEFSGQMVLTNISGNTWIGSYAGCVANVGCVGGGNKTLSDTLTQLRITSTSGTAVFDAGSVNILYE